MKTSNKIKLANLTTWIMILTISLIVLFFIGFLIANTFELRVFTRRASDFIAYFVGLSFLAVACSAILNISINISLIADSRIDEFRDSASGLIPRKFYLYGVVVVGLLISFLFVGDFLTRQREKAKLPRQATDVVEKY